EKDAHRQELATAAVDELVRHEPGLGRKSLGKVLVDPARELGERPALQPIPPHACEHAPPPSSACEAALDITPRAAAIKPRFTGLQPGRGVKPRQARLLASAW